MTANALAFCLVCVNYVHLGFYKIEPWRKLFLLKKTLKDPGGKKTCIVAQHYFKSRFKGRLRKRLHKVAVAATAICEGRIFLVEIAMSNLELGFYYKHITIVIDDSRAAPQFGSSFTLVMCI